MSDDHDDDDSPPTVPPLPEQLTRLQLPFLRTHYHQLAQQAAEQGWGHIQYLEHLVRAK